MSNRQIIDSSTSEFLEKAYQSADMAWDLGEPTPVFNQWINSERNTLSICVLGAGNGWDALNFAKKGHHVTAVDFAFSAIQNMSQMAEILGVELDLLHPLFRGYDIEYDSRYVLGRVETHTIRLISKKDLQKMNERCNELIRNNEYFE